MTVRRILRRCRDLLRQTVAALWSVTEIRVYQWPRAQVLPATLPDLPGTTPWTIEILKLDQVHAHPGPGAFKRDLGYAPAGGLCGIIAIDSTAAAWGFQTPVVTRWPITETGTELALSEAGVCLITFEVAPAWRGHHLYQALLAALLQRQAPRMSGPIFIWCRTGNSASRRAIEQSGFTLCQIHHRRRVLGLHRSRIVAVPGTG